MVEHRWLTFVYLSAGATDDRVVHCRVLSETMERRLPISLSGMVRSTEVSQVAVLYNRRNSNHRQHRGDGDQEWRPGVCGVRSAWSEVLPNSSNGANGQTRRHLEIVRQCGKCETVFFGSSLKTLQVV